MCYYDWGKDSTYSSEPLNQDVVTFLSATALQSEEILIYRVLTLQTFESKVIYCLKFSQGLLLEPGRERLNSERSCLEDWTLSGANKKVKFSDEDNVLLLKLKGEDLS